MHIDIISYELRPRHGSTLLFNRLVLRHLFYLELKLEAAKRKVVYGGGGKGG